VIVGVLHEPVFTGDRSEVGLTVLVPDPANPTDSRAQNVKPVEGLAAMVTTAMLRSPKLHGRTPGLNCFRERIA